MGGILICLNDLARDFILSYTKHLETIISGITLISLALCADGAIGNVQEKTLKQYSAASGEMVSLF